MALPRGVLTVIGVIAFLSETILLIFNLAFAVTLSKARISSSVRQVEIVATVLNFVNISLLSLLLARQFQYRDGAHIQDFGHGRRRTYVLAGLCGTFCALSASATVVGLGVIRSKIAGLPTLTIGSSTEALASAGLGVWIVSLATQIAFIVAIVLIQRSDFHKQVQPFQTELGSQSVSVIKDTMKGTVRSIESVESSPSSYSGRSSVRASLSSVVSPITSKTKLISGTQKTTHKRQSLDSGYRESTSFSEDSFDSWDTSAVDAHARQAVLGGSSLSLRYLETIPASPIVSRSPSPGNPLDSEHISKNRTRSRSCSPKTRGTEPTGKSSPVPSTDSSTKEAHIHPLFRSDSPIPPPAATPGTVVTAAPGAGQVIPRRQSMASLNRKRSGSLPTHPLAAARSLDSIKRAMEIEDNERESDGVEGERKLTPPIPDWILGQGPRSSLSRGMSTRGSRRNSPPTSVLEQVMEV